MMRLALVELVAHEVGNRRRSRGNPGEVEVRGVEPVQRGEMAS